jgi:hypothetical protein
MNRRVAKTRSGMVAIATGWELPEHSEAKGLLGQRAQH